MSHTVGTQQENFALDERIDQVCTPFEIACKAALQGSRWPAIEDALTAFAGSGRHDLLRELVLLEIHYRRRGGQQPIVDEYHARFPELDRAWLIRAVAPASLLAERPPIGSPVAQMPSLGAGRIPPRLGDYRILREVGRGGMGLVYEAIQESLGRHVALKVLPFNGWLGPTHLERFQREARSAAKLHHTNIVPVFGVGEHEGVHYYAMQYIEGVGLHDVLREVKQRRRAQEAASPTGSQDLAADVAASLVTGRFAQSPAEACLPGGNNASSDGTPVPAANQTEPKSDAIWDDRSLNEDSENPAALRSVAPGWSQAEYFRGVARIGLQVAEALEYAHRQGILHRDIKPSNLLLDTAGTVWVTDFGLAKAEGGEDLTCPGDIVGTLRYMAPERFQGHSEPRSDVYSLGLTLYELLTLRPAFSESDRAPLIEQTRTETPPPPRQLDVRIPRDLETIVLKAMAKEPSARYATAEALADDLHRYLADRPIQARRSTMMEQTWRWCRRNPIVAGLFLALLIVLTSGLAGVTWQWRRAEANAQQTDEHRRRAEKSYRLAREGLEECVAKVAEDPRLNSGPLEDLRREVLHAELLFYQKFVELRGDEPDFQAERGRAFRELGNVTQQLASKTEAIDYYQKALAIFSELLRDHPDVADYQAELGKNHENLGVMYRFTGRPQEAEQAFQRALIIDRKLVHDHSAIPRHRSSLAHVLHNLAVVYQETNRARAAEETYQQALTLSKELVQENPTIALYKDELALTYNNLGLIFAASGRNQLAEQAYQEARTLGTDLVREHPGVVRYKAGLGLASNNLGLLYHDTQRYQEAEAVERETLRIGQELVRDHPANTDFAIQLGGSQCNLGGTLAATKRTEEASELCAQAVAVLEAAVAKESNHRTGQTFLRNSRDALAMALDQLGRHGEALHMWERALEVPDGRPPEEYRFQHARTLVRMQQVDRAASEVRSVVEASDASGSALYGAARFYVFAAGVLKGKDPSAEDYAVHAVQFLRQAYARGFQDLRALRADFTFDPLRDRPDFQHLLTELKVSPVLRVPDAIEGEDLRIVGCSANCRAGTQDMRGFGLDLWSNDKQLFAHIEQAGAWTELEVPVATDGPQRLIVYLTKAADFGIVQFSVDGKLLAKPIDLCLPGSQPSVGPIDLGVVNLKKGTAILRLEVVGANSESKGYRYAWGLDCLVLQPEQVR